MEKVCCMCIPPSLSDLTWLDLTWPNPVLTQSWLSSLHNAISILSVLYWVMLFSKPILPMWASEPISEKTSPFLPLPPCSERWREIEIIGDWEDQMVLVRLFLKLPFCPYRPCQGNWLDIRFGTPCYYVIFQGRGEVSFLKGALPHMGSNGHRCFFFFFILRHQSSQFDQIGLERWLTSYLSMTAALIDDDDTFWNEWIRRDSVFSYLVIWKRCVFLRASSEEVRFGFRDLKVILLSIASC